MCIFLFCGGRSFTSTRRSLERPLFPASFTFYLTEATPELSSSTVKKVALYINYTHGARGGRVVTRQAHVFVLICGILGELQRRGGCGSLGVDPGKDSFRVALNSVLLRGPARSQSSNRDAQLIRAIDTLACPRRPFESQPRTDAICYVFDNRARKAENVRERII